MRTPKDLFTDIKSINVTRHDGDDPEKMDFMMRTIKAFRTSSNQSNVLSQEELSKQRTDSERLSKLVTPTSLVEVEGFAIGHINCEWVKPKFSHRTDKLIMYCHGGGYTNGGLGYARILAVKLAQVTGIETVSFEYRLAPENPYPAGIDDAEAVWNYIMHMGYGAKNIIIAGDSAGGNMALELMLRLKEENRILPEAAILMSPWTDMRLKNNSYVTYKDKDPMLTYEYIDTMRKAYAGEDAEFNDYHYSPILGNLENMPPTLIQTGSNEILRDDSEHLKKKYNKQGSFAKLEIYQGCWHVFQQFPIAKASLAMNSVKGFLDDVIK